jgi:hypothetical protein
MVGALLERRATMPLRLTMPMTLADPQIWIEADRLEIRADLSDNGAFVSVVEHAPLLWRSRQQCFSDIGVAGSHRVPPSSFRLTEVTGARERFHTPPVFGVRSFNEESKS